MVWHWMKPNDTLRTPERHIAFDTETQTVQGDMGEQIHFLRLGCAYAWTEKKGKLRPGSWCDFTSPAEFWSFVSQHTRKNGALWVWAHNAVFDTEIVCLRQEMVEQRLTVRSWYARDGVFIVRGRYRGHSVVFADTFNWWRHSLADLGEQLGLPKLSIDFATATDADLSTYCRRDTEIVTRAVQGLTGFARENDLGVFKATAAGQSMQSYRHKYVTNDKQCSDTQRNRIGIHQHKGCRHLERHAYYAAPVQCYFLGHVATRAAAQEQPFLPGNVYSLDVQGAYPAVMRGNRFPCELASYCATPDMVTLGHALQSYGCIAYVRICSMGKAYPLRTDKGVLWARGHYWTCLAGPMLRQAYEAGHVKEVGIMSAYETADLFSAYVAEWQRNRKVYTDAGDTLRAGLCKLLLNSLHGKFAQHPVSWIDTGNDCPLIDTAQHCSIDAQTGQIKTLRWIAGHEQELVDAEETECSFVAASAFVTAYAIERMDELKAIAGTGNVLYQCVDTLHVLRAGYENLAAAGEVSRGEMGKLRLVDVYDHVHYRGYLDRVQDGEEVVAGLPARATPVANGVWQVEKWEGAQQVYARPGNGTIAVTPCVVQYDRAYRRGEVLDSGWVRPLTVVTETGDAPTRGQ